ncbi:MAG: hypothetical protein P8N11_00320 [Gammaproteobacteria bacterium]|jgi:hypothetical protein|nr:hypothetical protein [Gammaproteobacteria bacterium]
MSQILVAWWNSMGLWRWPNLLLVVCACYLALIYEAVPAAWVNHGNKELGNLEIIFYTKGRIVPQEKLSTRIEISEAADLVLGIESSAFTPISLSSVEQRVLELELAIPNDKTKELKVYVSDKGANIAVWNLGRLY